MLNRIPPLGILQGRLTPSVDGNIQSFPKDNWQNEFAVAKQLGFECVEWLLKRDSLEENPFFAPFGPLEIKNTASLCGITVSSVHGFYNKGTDYSSKLVTIVLRAWSMGAKTVLISFFDGNALKTENDKEFARRQIFSALPFCKTLKVRLGVETEMMAGELLDFVRSFRHPFVGVYYDIGNMASMGVDVAEEIRLLSGHIVGVHVKDRERNFGKTVPLGEGCADFESAFRALRDVDYSDALIIQGARKPGIDDTSLSSGYLTYCRKLVSKIWKGGGK